MAQVWMLADPCADPGFFARGVQARLPENSSDNVFFSFLSSTFTVLRWFINGLFKKTTIILQGFGGGEEIPTFSRRAQPFPGGGGGKTFSKGVGGPNANHRNP